MRRPDHQSGPDNIAASKRIWKIFDGPAPWLIYLPLLFLPWLGVPPSLWQLAASIVGVLIFLPTYILGSRGKNRLLIFCATGAMIIAFAFYWAACNWTVIAIYAVSMFGRLRPFRTAVFGILAATATIVCFSFWTHQPVIWWLFGAVLAPMVGIGQAFRSLLLDQEDALKLAHEEVRKIAQVAERERMGRDLHDLLGRTLTLIAVKADLAQRLATADSERCRAEIADIASAAREGLSQVRSALSGETPANLPLEVTEAIRALSVAGVEVEVDGDPTTLPAMSGAVLAMVLREAVTNVIRHAEAVTCRIRLTSSARSVGLTVEDDGRGGPIAEGRGLKGMRARIEAVGGAFDIVSDGQGTRLQVSLSGESL